MPAFLRFLLALATAATFAAAAAAGPLALGPVSTAVTLAPPAASGIVVLPVPAAPPTPVAGGVVVVTQPPPAPAAHAGGMDPRFLPAIVAYEGGEAPGTIIIDTATRYLYLVEEGGLARRYGVGIGREGFGWTGAEVISRKAEWPDWRPPAEMRARQPELPEFVPGGPDNPLGARALYLGTTLYRIHGTNEPWTIGGAVSSGCFRMRNEDVIDLYGRVEVGTRVVVI